MLLHVSASAEWNCLQLPVSRSADCCLPSGAVCSYLCLGLLSAEWRCLRLPVSESAVCRVEVSAVSSYLCLSLLSAEWRCCRCGSRAASDDCRRYRPPPRTGSPARGPLTLCSSSDHSLSQGRRATAKVTPGHRSYTAGVRGTATRVVRRASGGRRAASVK